MINQQLEIALPAKPCRRVRPARAARARWWFSQMHRVVEEAGSWTSSTSSRHHRSTLSVAKDVG
jgi:hypothetical protein